MLKGLFFFVGLNLLAGLLSRHIGNIAHISGLITGALGGLLLCQIRFQDKEGTVENP
jgi:membrane associated rhomboid family serine protease